MCVTIHSAELPQTYVGAWDINHPEFGYRHVLAYQNKPISQSDQPNCMLLHIPAAAPLQPDYLLDTTGCEWLLQQMADNGRKQSRTRFSPENHVFEMGIYHIAMLNEVHPAAVAEALSQIPGEKRPDISDEFIHFFADHFPDYPLLLCCFNNKESKKASPILIHFEPQRPEVFQLNLLDAHGHLPIIGQMHFFERTLIVGSYKLKKNSGESHAFDHSNVPIHLLPFLPRYGFAEDLRADLPNADLLISVDDVANERSARIKVGTLPRFSGFNV